MPAFRAIRPAVRHRVETLERRTLLSAPAVQSAGVGPAGVDDPDDEISESVSLAVGGSASGVIAGVNDVDIYRFTVTAGQTVGFDIDVDAPGSVLDSFLRVLNIGGATLAASDDGYGPEP